MIINMCFAFAMSNKMLSLFSCLHFRLHYCCTFCNHEGTCIINNAWKTYVLLALKFEKADLINKLEVIRLQLNGKSHKAEETPEQHLRVEEQTRSRPV